MDRRATQRQAQQALDSGKPRAAIQTLWGLVDRAHIDERELTGYLRLMARAFVDANQPRAAATVHLFLKENARAAALVKHSPLDLARVHVADGNRIEAAKAFQEGGWLGHAAIQLEEHGDYRGARVLWERLSASPDLRSNAYVTGLVRFNLGRACQRLSDKNAARRALIESVHALEAAADGFEAQGLRERAYDCFLAIRSLGVNQDDGTLGPFEYLAEGYINCIRILKEDNLKYYALQYYEDFQREALERGELHAAATLYREAAEYARVQNMPWEGHYRIRAAEVQVEAAEKTLRDGGAVELAENAFAAAIDGFNAVGAYSRVRNVYGRLATLPLGDKRQARYNRLQARLANIADDPITVESFPDYLRTPMAYPEIWKLDTIEWEQGGDPAETMGEVLLAPRMPPYQRRRALLARLHQLGAGDNAGHPSNLASLATLLGKVEIYTCLSPLEKLSEHPDPSVRAACVRACQNLLFKRTFITVERGLEDEHPDVRNEALQAVSKLHFPYAFDPLQRIYRQSDDPQVRRAALMSIAKVNSLPAVELMIDVLRHGDRVERDLTRDLLIRTEHVETTPLLRQAAAVETGTAKELMEDILRQRR